ncbi:MAG TPA: hypothetical protein VF730_05430 [Terracidiphilus sp.]
MLLAAVCCAEAAAQRLSDLKTPTPLPPGSTLVIGFLGGYDRWNDEHRSVRRIILSLRDQPGVYAESVSNHHRRVALKLIRRALDTSHDGKLEFEEKTAARIILFGQSWGGAATIATARDLEKLGIPVLLTVQVDSVGRNDGLVPANVAAAVNFFQHDPLTLWGRSEIRAEDPARTAILGNFQETYRSRPVDESNASWPRKVMGGSHVKLEQDPAVWNRVEQYISDAIAGRWP